ncbi:minor tail protein [Gordonia phage Hollow]|nr:minor tail protein [Gordonia phage Hollow]
MTTPKFPGYRSDRPAGERFSTDVLNELGFTFAKARSTFVNLKSDFNAKGNGTGDDRPSFQAALTYLNSVGGGVLYVPPGVYPVAAAVGLGNTPINRVKILGAPGFSAEIRSAGNFSPFAGSLYRSSLDGLFINPNDTGAPGLNVHMVESDLTELLIDNWNGEGVRLNDGTFGDLGLLNRLQRCHIVQSTGVGVFQTYRWVDSWIDSNNIGSTQDNLSLEGGPLRVTQNHLNGAPLRNINLRGNKRITITDNIMEGALREAVLYTMPPWLTEDSPQIQVNSNNISNGGKESAGTFACIAFKGVSQTSRVSGLSVIGNTIACEDPGSGWSYCILSDFADDIVATSNQWADGFTIAPTLLNNSPQRYSVAGNTV